jgi:hypothetical protein
MAPNAAATLFPSIFTSTHSPQYPAKNSVLFFKNSVVFYPKQCVVFQKHCGVLAQIPPCFFKAKTLREGALAGVEKKQGGEREIFSSFMQHK